MINDDFIIKNNTLIKYIGQSVNVIIPSTVIRIQKDAFKYSDIISVFIPSSVRFIEKGVFRKTDNLKVIQFESSIIEINKKILFNLTDIFLFHVGISYSLIFNKLKVLIKSKTDYLFFMRLMSYSKSLSIKLIEDNKMYKSIYYLMLRNLLVLSSNLDEFSNLLDIVIEDINDLQTLIKIANSFGKYNVQIVLTNYLYKRFGDELEDISKKKFDL